MMNLPPASTISVPAGSAGAPVSPDQTRAILPSVMRIRALAIGAPPVPSIKLPPRTSRLAPFACVKAKSSRQSEKLRWPMSRICPISDNFGAFPGNGYLRAMILGGKQKEKPFRLDLQEELV